MSLSVFCCYPEEINLFVADVYLREIGAFEKMSETYQQKWLYDVADTMEGSEVLPKEALDTVRKKGIVL